MEPQSPQPPRTPRGGAKERYEAEESAKGLIAGLVGLDCADIIRRSNRVQEILEDLAQHAPAEGVSLEQLQEERKKVDTEIDQLSRELDERDRKMRVKTTGNPPGQPQGQTERKPRNVPVKDPRFAPLFQNEPEENDTDKGWEPEL
ncbi:MULTISPECIES: hypothetical protein [Corynebacterium]|uniref:hypothetical protein n=1 Tax=Corynebacterium TaxID=1716 RepID=UPI001EF1FD84|nr:hypothetical protein [Corynebacterium kefirresidentii]MCG7241136.1 hypothetical protein [Corynebacterium kefirresidentii]MCG7283562.1 hypothetical protein [Corynebacterium kefirresidentii]MCT2188392.1 hypothetical protein [Corynebacterium kefirresidentii]